MNVDSIREYCLAFPGATEKLQWGDALCFKVSEKMFAVLGLDDVRFTFKCTADSFAELIERENIRPAPYLARHKWVVLDRLDALSAQELKDFVRLSYEMVLAKAPKPRPGKKSKTRTNATTRPSKRR
jgi:predicted DNA-binding protein (MmcQ/YjbR family)